MGKLSLQTPTLKGATTQLYGAFLLEDELGRSVELVTRKALSPHIGSHILQTVEYVEIGD